MEKPMTDDVGSDDLEVEAAPASPVVGRSKDAQDFLRTGGAEAETGADAEAGADAVEVDGVEGGAGVEVSTIGMAASTGVSWVAVDTTTLTVGSDDSVSGLVCEWAVPAADTDVLEETGEAGTGGVSDIVETSVSEEETVSGR